MENRYIENVNKIMRQQEEKGLSTYGKLLQDNKELSITERIQNIEEELVDALMYLEHLKDVGTQAESVHGEWIVQDKGRTKFMCSNCKSKNHDYCRNFCSNCGADMRGEKND